MNRVMKEREYGRKRQHENGRGNYGRWDNVIKVNLKVKNFFTNAKKT